MHVIAYPECNLYGVSGIVGLEQPETLTMPGVADRRVAYFEFYSDASNGEKSYTGGVGLLAGGPVLNICQRQHLSAPDSHLASRGWQATPCS